MKPQPLGSASHHPVRRRNWLLVPLVSCALLTSLLATSIWLDVTHETSYSARLVPVTAPLLGRWLDARDRRLWLYAHRTLREAPYPYSTRWLEHELNRPNYLDCQPVLHRDYHYGLRRPEVAIRLSLVALRHDTIFQRDFLAALAAKHPPIAWWEAMLTEAERDPVSWVAGMVVDGEPPPSLQARVDELRRLRGRRYLRASIQRRLSELESGLSAKKVLDDLDEKDRREVVERLLEECPSTLAALTNVADSGPQPQAYWAAERLFLHGDRGRMESYANQDLALLSQGARPGQDRLLELLRIAEAFPESRFARGCKAYGKIRGRSYFSPSTKVRPYSHRPAEQEAAWRAWIQEFPDHPGVDDAQYGIIRTLEWQGKRVEALRLAWSAWHNPAGDGDMVGLLSQRCLFLLDAGTTLAELQTFEKETHDPAVTYALAVRLARYHRYYEALELTRGIELTSPPHPFPDHLLPAFVTAQRASWQKLASMNVEQRAHRWAREDGWQIGYLLLWGGSRAVLESKSLPELAQRPDGPPLREEVRRANHHAVAIALFDRCNGAEALYSPIMLLEYQFHSYSAAETNLIWGDQRAVAREAERRTRELLRRYPSSSLCDDALMLVYSINGDKRLLEEVVRRYPKGDQAVNARRLLRPDNPEWLPGLKSLPRGS